ncbi:hypothetical protein HPB47_018095 [Ixodes persulcatus]|uniref:Uncharacterized protein n=1 Tax=Ixodes persulcatus TaxID=34615 RepID=A0AC60QLL3_IXOPE|nr:hypothetical protein HPB47_018095 [Ixodes persulcatus]
MRQVEGNVSDDPWLVANTTFDLARIRNQVHDQRVLSTERVLSHGRTRSVLTTASSPFRRPSATPRFAGSGSPPGRSAGL